MCDEKAEREEQEANGLRSVTFSPSLLELDHKYELTSDLIGNSNSSSKPACSKNKPKLKRAMVTLPCSETTRVARMSTSAI